MTLNTFEGGTPAATITVGNSGGASGDAFNAVAIVAGGSATYIADAYRGARAGRFASAGTAGVVQAEYTTSVDVAGAGKVYGRCRFRLPVLPPDATGVRVMVVADGTGSFRADLRVNNAGLISVRGPAGTALATSTFVYTAGTWCDVGFAVLVVSATIGQIEAKIYDPNGVVAETLTSAANQNTLGAGGVFRLQNGMVRSLANYTVDLDDLAFDLADYPNVPVAETVQVGPWSGAVTDDGFTVGYVLAGTASARLAVSTSPALTSPVFSPAGVPDADGMVKLAVTGLDPDTVYHYGVEADGNILATDHGECRTFPTAGAAASFSVAFGSCQFTMPTDNTYAAIAARNGPHGRVFQIVHMGDLNYRDWDGTATQAQVFDQHMVTLGAASAAAPLAAIPFNYAWDNHDWGGETSDASAPAGNIVAAALRQVFCHYPLPATNGRGIYHSWVIGRVRFIQLDVRSYRDPQSDPEGPAKTMLGAEQVAWLAAELAEAEPVKILCGNYPWRDGVDGDGRWGSYTDEFLALNTTLASVAGGRVFVIFGDRHYLAADDGTAADTHGVPQAGGAPFQQSSVAVADTWSAGSYTIAPAVMQAYGVLDIDDQGDAITVTYSGITSLDGIVRVAMTTEFAVEITATGNPLLPAFGAGGAGAVTADAAGTLDLPPLDAESAGTVALDGGGALLLPALTLDAVGDLLEPINGGGDMQLPALDAAGAGEILPGCEQWPYDTACLPDGWPATPAGMDAGQLSAYEFARELLDGLTLGKYGLCTLTVRPCGVGCAFRAGLRMLDGGWFGPYLHGGQVYNGCGCTVRCSCTVASEVLLDGPVYDILRVRVDGLLVDPATYRVDGGVRLVRVDGNTWPMVQDLNASAGLAGTFDVTYRRGSPVPRGGRRAMAALMVELQKAQCGDSSCRLPSRVTNIVREGVTYSMLDDPSALLEAGRTGVPEVDMWLALTNPNQNRTRMRVYSPDLGPIRRQTWPRP